MSFNVIGVKDGHKEIVFCRLAGEARRQAEAWAALDYSEVRVVSCEGATVSLAALEAVERSETPRTALKSAA